jgi:hypothetical protein
MKLVLVILLAGLTGCCGTGYNGMLHTGYDPAAGPWMETAYLPPPRDGRWIIAHWPDYTAPVRWNGREWEPQRIGLISRNPEWWAEWMEVEK